MSCFAFRVTFFQLFLREFFLLSFPLPVLERDLKNFLDVHWILNCVQSDTWVNFSFWPTQMRVQPSRMPQDELLLAFCLFTFFICLLRTELSNAPPCLLLRVRLLLGRVVFLWDVLGFNVPVSVEDEFLLADKKKNTILV